VSGAVLLAFAAGACAVLGAWEALAAIDGRASVRALERWLAPLRAGRAPTPAERRRLALVATGTLAACGWLVGGGVAAVLLAAGGPLAVRQALSVRAARRRAEVARGAPAVARALADAIGAGHSVRGAVGAAAPGVGGAAGDELRRAAAALDLGEPTVAVLEGLRTRARDPAYDTLVAAILLQAEAGGDLATLLRDLAARLDTARRDAAEARSATAQARFTAWLVAALPAGSAILAELAAPGFLAGIAGEPLTAALAGTSIALQLVAVLAIRRIART
jgi:tight adherence protein B